MSLRLRRALPRLPLRLWVVRPRAQTLCLMCLCPVWTVSLARPVLSIMLCPVLMCVLQLRRRLGREWSGVPPLCAALSSPSLRPPRVRPLVFY